jgi:hypothetical protein
MQKLGYRTLYPIFIVVKRKFARNMLRLDNLYSLSTWGTVNLSTVPRVRAFCSSWFLRVETFC